MPSLSIHGEFVNHGVRTGRDRRGSLHIFKAYRLSYQWSNTDNELTVTGERPETHDSSIIYPMSNTGTQSKSMQTRKSCIQLVKYILRKIREILL